MADALKIVDLSKDYPSLVKGRLSGGAPQGLIVHHTASSDTATPQSIASDWASSGRASSQYIMGRDGTVYQMMPSGSKAWQIKPSWNPAEAWANNSTTEGIELIAKNDSDVTPAQVKALQQFAIQQAQTYGFDPATHVLGHGEVNGSAGLNGIRRPDGREDSEGMTAVRGLRSYLASNPDGANGSASQAIANAFPTRAPPAALADAYLSGDAGLGYTPTVSRQAHPVPLAPLPGAFTVHDMAPVSAADSLAFNPFNQTAAYPTPDALFRNDGFSAASGAEYPAWANMSGPPDERSAMPMATASAPVTPAYGGSALNEAQRNAMLALPMASAATPAAINNSADAANFYAGMGLSPAPTVTPQITNQASAADFYTGFGLPVAPTNAPPSQVASNLPMAAAAAAYDPASQQAGIGAGYNAVPEDLRNALLSGGEAPPPVPKVDPRSIAPIPLPDPRSAEIAALTAPVSTPSPAPAQQQTVTIGGHVYNVGQSYQLGNGASFTAGADGKFTKTANPIGNPTPLQLAIKAQAPGAMANLNNAVSTVKDVAGTAGGAVAKVGSLFGGLFGNHSAAPSQAAPQAVSLPMASANSSGSPDDRSSMSYADATRAAPDSSGSPDDRGGGSSLPMMASQNYTPATGGGDTNGTPYEDSGWAGFSQNHAPAADLASVGPDVSIPTSSVPKYITISKQVQVPSSQPIEQGDGVHWDAATGQYTLNAAPAAPKPTYVTKQVQVANPAYHAPAPVSHPMMQAVVPRPAPPPQPLAAPSGYVYLPNGSGGYAQAGVAPKYANMTPSQQYAAAAGVNYVPTTVEQQTNNHNNSLAGGDGT